MSEELEPFEVRAEKLLSRVFRGMHHVWSLKKTGTYWTCIHNGSLSTFDFDQLTRLVLGAHEYCCRIDISNGGPRSLKIVVCDRKREGDFTDRHPTLEQAVERWNKRER